MNPQCVLCLGGLETHPHLFFECQFSASVWVQVLAKNGISRSVMSLSQVVDWAVQHRRGRGFQNAIFKLSLAAAIYFIWRERNAWIFQGKTRNESALAGVILEAARSKLSSWTSVKYTAHNRRLCDDWLLRASAM